MRELRKLIPEIDDYKVLSFKDDYREVFRIPVADNEGEPYLLIEPMSYRLHWDDVWPN